MGYGALEDDFCTAARKALVAVLLSTSAIVAGGVAIPSAAHAQTQTSFDVPAGPLNRTLAAFGRQAGLQLSYEASIANGKTSAGIQGSATREQALARILQGSGLTYSFKGARNVLIAPPGTAAGGAIPAGTIPLDAIDVQEAGQSPYGPGVGYVAERSATGSKTDMPIVETPQSISVVTQKQIVDQQPQNLNQALRYSPGVAGEVAGVSTVNQANNILLRGFSPLQYLDGLRTSQGANTTGIDPYFLNRIEVLSGPSGVLYGQGSPGGIINMGSKLPTATPFHEVVFGFGNYGQYQGKFDFGGPIDKNGKFLYRLTGVGLTQDSQVDFTKTQELGIAPALTWRPDADTSLTIMAKYISNPAMGGYVWVPAVGTVLPNKNGTIPTNFFSGDPNYNTYKQTVESIGTQFSHSFNDIFSVQQNFRYEHVKDDVAVVFPSGYAGGNPLIGNPGPQNVLNRYIYTANPNETNYDTIDLDNRLKANFSTGFIHHDTAFGLEYLRFTNTLTTAGTTMAVSPINIFDPVYGVTIPPVTTPLNPNSGWQNQIGLYAQDHLTIDRLHLLLGVRQDWAEGSNSTTSGITHITTTSQYSIDKPTYRAGAVYEFDNGVAPYVSYVTSFVPQNGTTFNGGAFLPTTSQQYEAGVKYQPKGSNVLLTAAVFDLTQQNVLTSDPNHAGFSVQTGEVRARGVEFQARANLTDAFAIMANYSYADVVNKKSNTTGYSYNTLGLPISTQGKTPVGVPSQMASLWADYTIHDGLARGFGFGGGVRYVGQSYGDTVNSFTVPSYTLFDAVLHYDFGEASKSLKGVTAQINATNLFDKTYVASCISGYPTYFPTTPGGSCYYGLRRTVLATLKYAW